MRLCVHVCVCVCVCARARVQAMLLLDEATSSLDAISESQVCFHFRVKVLT